MTKQEFDAWKAETARSRNQWIMDEIHNGRDGQDLVVFKGGEDGQFIRIDQSGLCELGSYEGAIPHIGEALFTITGVHKCATFDEGCTRLLTALGARFLLEFVGIK